MRIKRVREKEKESKRSKKEKRKKEKREKQSEHPLTIVKMTVSSPGDILRKFCLSTTPSRTVLLLTWPIIR
jgi:hypothetical protein